jgi:hypothetical protein
MASSINLRVRLSLPPVTQAWMANKQPLQSAEAYLGSY